MIIATHSGKFHADDVWAVAALDIVFPGCELLRTRDPERLKHADFIVDVGGEWDAARGRFDHHQKGFDGARASGVMYASAGLVWKEHGARCVAAIAQSHAGETLEPEQARQIAAAIDTDLVQYLDMSDTGAARSAPGSYGLSAIVSGYNPNWMDEQAALASGNPEAAEDLRLRQFRRAMEVCADIMINAVKYRLGGTRALEQVRQSERLENGRLLLLKNGSLPWSSVVRNEMPKISFVLAYHRAEDRYTVNTVPAAPDSFVARKDLPKAWAGLRDMELAEVTGVSDAIFCHNNLFVAAAKSYEGALTLARMALAA